MAEFTFAPLTPTAFLDRSAASFAERTAVIDGSRRFTYAELADRVGRLVSALAGAGVEPGDRVAVLCTNNHLNLELHQGVPMRGAVIVPVNTRLAAVEMAYILRHSGASLLVASREFASRADELAAEAGIRLIREDGDGADGYEAWLNSVEADPADRGRSTSAA